MEEKMKKNKNILKILYFFFIVLTVVSLFSSAAFGADSAIPTGTAHVTDAPLSTFGFLVSNIKIISLCSICIYSIILYNIHRNSNLQGTKNDKKIGIFNIKNFSIGFYYFLILLNMFTFLYKFNLANSIIFSGLEIYFLLKGIFLLFLFIKNIIIKRLIMPLKVSNNFKIILFIAIIATFVFIYYSLKSEIDFKILLSIILAITTFVLLILFIKNIVIHKSILPMEKDGKLKEGSTILVLIALILLSMLPLLDFDHMSNFSYSIYLILLSVSVISISYLFIRYNIIKKCFVYMKKKKHLKEALIILVLLVLIYLQLV